MSLLYYSTAIDFRSQAFSFTALFNNVAWYEINEEQRHQRFGITKRGGWGEEGVKDGGERRKKGKERGREGGMKGGREGGREKGGREGGREGGKKEDTRDRSASN